jgi:hypothetical protein
LFGYFFDAPLTNFFRHLQAHKICIFARDYDIGRQGRGSSGWGEDSLSEEGARIVSAGSATGSIMFRHAKVSRMASGDRVEAGSWVEDRFGTWLGRGQPLGRGARIVSAGSATGSIMFRHAKVSRMAFVDKIKDGFGHAAGSRIAMAGGNNNNSFPGRRRGWLWMASRFHVIEI